MSDAGEGLVDADARIQERLEELARSRADKVQHFEPRDPDAQRELESLKLARTELTRQIETTAHDARRRQLTQALEEVERRIADVTARLV